MNRINKLPARLPVHPPACAAASTSWSALSLTTRNDRSGSEIKREVGRQKVRNKRRRDRRKSSSEKSLPPPPAQMVGRIRIGGMAWLAMAVARSGRWLKMARYRSRRQPGFESRLRNAATFTVGRGHEYAAEGEAASSWPRADSCIFNYGKREERDGTERALADEIYIMRAALSRSSSSSSSKRVSRGMTIEGGKELQAGRQAAPSH